MSQYYPSESNQPYGGDPNPVDPWNNQNTSGYAGAPVYDQTQPQQQYNTYSSGAMSPYESTGMQPGQTLPYGGYGYNPGAPVLPEHPQATTVMVLGILSLFTVVTGPFAWVIGNRARAEIKRNPGMYAESGSLTVGWVLGIISTIIGIISIAFLLISVVLMLLALGMAAGG